MTDEYFPYICCFCKDKVSEANDPTHISVCRVYLLKEQLREQTMEFTVSKYQLESEITRLKVQLEAKNSIAEVYAESIHQVRNMLKQTLTHFEKLKEENNLLKREVELLKAKLT